jgi:hypothetical protein
MTEHICTMCWFDQCENCTGPPCPCLQHREEDMPQDVRRVTFSGSPLAHLVGTARHDPEVSLCGRSPFPEKWQEAFPGTRTCTACIDKAVKLK